MLCLDINLLTPKIVKLFLFPKSILPLLSAICRFCCKKNLQTFLANSVVPYLFKLHFKKR